MSTTPPPTSVQTVTAMILFPRWWIEQIRDGLQGDLPSGPLGDWAFIFREQLTDALESKPDAHATLTSSLTAAEARVRGLEAMTDVRWAVNVLLEKIAVKFENWDTLDIWRSNAADTVREFKHRLDSAALSQTEEGPR